MSGFRRITQDPAVMGGKPCIRGQRVAVGMIVGQIGTGRSIDALLADYPSLAREDVLEALRYAAWRAEERNFDLLAGPSWDDELAEAVTRRAKTPNRDVAF